MQAKPTRVAIYLRVSKDDGSRETDNQLLQLRGFCGGGTGTGSSPSTWTASRARRAAASAVTSTACSPTLPAGGSIFDSFGGPFMQRYDEIRPIPDAFFEVRRDLYSLYPLLVHTYYFGGGYPGMVRSVLERFGV